MHTRTRQMVVGSMQNVFDVVLSSFPASSIATPKVGFTLWNVSPSRTSYLRVKAQTNHLGKAEPRQSRAIQSEPIRSFRF